ncbi:hypothetical protein CM19_01920 [Candidatus Acidianus copahuensis]|uniref:Uncharacterized protein n=1 Tax=Candidatus Acidianus copahuensis TaxID=1160895 RepID=A0A031LUV5_9CREN|nr:hypothetical protein [Candidatus Acidianus copahuensis]EZQ11279.1 hypothetical protein CM19_01920 [Candidatus Acidianus copahuensis]
MEKALSAKIKLLAGSIALLIAFTIFIIYLPTITSLLHSSSSQTKVIDSQAVDKVIGGNWIENISSSGNAVINGTEAKVTFSNGTSTEISTSQIQTGKISQYLQFIDNGLNSISFYSFYQNNSSILQITILNYSSKSQAESVFELALGAVEELQSSNLSISNFSSSNLSIHVFNITNYKAFVVEGKGFSIAIGENGNQIATVFLKPENRTAVESLIKYLIKV